MLSFMYLNTMPCIDFMQVFFLYFEYCAEINACPYSLSYKKGESTSLNRKCTQAVVKRYSFPHDVALLQLPMYL